MRIVFHNNFFKTDYIEDCSSIAGRMEAVISELTNNADFHFIEPLPAEKSDILLAHTESYIEGVAQNTKLYDMAMLAAGGAINAASSAIEGETAFAAIRPPGHHAYKNMGWGYCYFSNLAISLLNLRNKNKINSAFIVDIDAHTGDGTKDVLTDWKEAQVFNPMAENNIEYFKVIDEFITTRLKKADILAVSAGFDSYKLDVGRKLETEDYFKIGYILKELSKKICNGRRYAVLEGGYYLPDLGKNVLAFCQGFKD